MFTVSCSMTDFLKNKKILVIDDDPVTLDLVKSVLVQFGVDPRSASAAKAGLDLAATGMFHAIILDRYLAKEDGHDVLTKLKEMPETKFTPVIMLTGESHKNEVQKSISLGASGYIIKPFTPQSFIKQVSKILSDKYELDID